jgi:hypothetical protein
MLARVQANFVCIRGEDLADANGLVGLHGTLQALRYICGLHSGPENARDRTLEHTLEPPLKPAEHAQLR